MTNGNNVRKADHFTVRSEWSLRALFDRCCAVRQWRFFKMTGFQVNRL
jgi:hypothetical protein